MSGMSEVSHFRMLREIGTHRHGLRRFEGADTRVELGSF